MFYLGSSRAGGGLQPEGSTSFMQDSFWGPTEPILKKAYLFVLQLSHDLTRFKAHCEEKMRGLVASTVGAMEIQQAKQRQERKVVWLLLTLCSEQTTGFSGQTPRASQPEQWFSKPGPGLPGHLRSPRAVINDLWTCSLTSARRKLPGACYVLCHPQMECEISSVWEIPRHAK